MNVVKQLTGDPMAVRERSGGLALASHPANVRLGDILRAPELDLDLRRSCIIIASNRQDHSFVLVTEPHQGLSYRRPNDH
jgi:DNA-binding IscR family transcriptional regulator